MGVQTLQETSLEHVQGLILTGCEGVVMVVPRKGLVIYEWERKKRVGRDMEKTARIHCRARLTEKLGTSVEAVDSFPLNRTTVISGYPPLSHSSRTTFSAPMF